MQNSNLTPMQNMQNKNYYPNELGLSLDPSFHNTLQEFDNHLAATLNCELIKFATEGADKTGDPEIILNHFYIKSQNGEVLLHKLIDETSIFWDCNGLDSTVSFTEYPNGELIQDNTMIITITYHI